MPVNSSSQGLFRDRKSTDSRMKPKPGLYHYNLEGKDEKSRVHLRIDPDESGLLMVNASKVVQLNPTAALMTYFYLEKTPVHRITRYFMHNYATSRKQVLGDMLTTSLQLGEIIHKDGGCPICDLDLEIKTPFSARPSAPYRMDLALTYRCNNSCEHCYNARPRNHPEMDTQAWKQVIDRLWDLRIPHLVFTGGEPTLRDDLPELIAYAEQKGQITGINTNGRRLADRSFLDELVKAGLDHVQITFESHDPEIHDRMVAARGAHAETLAGLRNVLETKLYMMTNTTLLTHNSPYLTETINFLADEGVPTVGINALIYSGRGETVKTGLPETDLPPLLDIARNICADRNLRLIWYTPTQYCHFNPVQMQLGVKGCTAALYNMCIEPDGEVLPCQSYYQTLGNILKDPWDAIWEHPLAVSIRERKDIPEGCITCDLLAECGGGCPLAREHQVIKPVTNAVFI